MTIFEADWICPASSSPIPNAAIAVDNGRIVSVGVGQKLHTDGEHVRFPGCAILPGFVNAHAHLELTVLRGFLEDLDFITWIRTVIQSKQQKITRDEMLLSARLGAIECLNAGVTCVGEV